MELHWKLTDISALQWLVTSLGHILFEPYVQSSGHMASDCYGNICNKA